MNIKEYCIINDLLPQYHLLNDKLKELEEIRLDEEEKRWTDSEFSHLITINSSFKEKLRKTKFTTEDIVIAMEELGVDFSVLENKKWYQFFKNNNDFLLRQAFAYLKFLSLI